MAVLSVYHSSSSLGICSFIFRVQSRAPRALQMKSLVLKDLPASRILTASSLPAMPIGELCCVLLQAWVVIRVAWRGPEWC